MAAEHFDPVTIETDRPGALRNITSTLQVAELLVENWSKPRGSAFVAAVQASMDHMAGKARAADVRAAFIAAAKEAGIFVREGQLLQ